MSNPAADISPVSKEHKQFYHEVLEGLASMSKYLPSKYFYDTKGDYLFQQIMQSPEYYLTDCEREILETQSLAIANKVRAEGDTFDVVGLGAGDGSKSVFLIKELLQKESCLNYFPVDISSHVISLLEEKMPKVVPGLKVKGYNGEYLEKLEQICKDSSRPKLVMFLGSNIGNFTREESVRFCSRLRHFLKPGDLLFIGFDLKKYPTTILKAYNDAAGYTKRFNLNLLERMNRELEADFCLANFDHYPVYNPETGTCKSYLISLRAQQISIGREIISFQQNEPIHMEVSQKYSLDDINLMADHCGCESVACFFDQKKWFADVLWRC